VQRNLYRNYCQNVRHSCYTACCLLHQELDLEPHIEAPVKVEGLYATMILSWASRGPIARRTAVVSGLMSGEEDSDKITHETTVALPDVGVFWSQTCNLKAFQAIHLLDWIALLEGLSGTYHPTIGSFLHLFLAINDAQTWWPRLRRPKTQLSW
jgi:hypothetical protein